MSAEFDWAGLVDENARLRAELADMREAMVRLRAVADRRAASADRLRAELDDLRCDDSCSRTVEELQARAWDAEAAIARVRELCEGPDYTLYHMVGRDRVLRALDGDE